MKKLLNKLNFKKSVAVFTSITFLISGVFGNSAFASIGSSMPAIENINFDNPIIPTSLGKITSAKYFDSEDIIINIQDLHCHAETQRKIASIIGYIDNTYNLKNVYLEGAFKTVDTSWLSAFNNNKNGTKVLEGLIDSGKLSGTEYYSIMNNKKNFVLGIEKEDLYKENIKLLGAILSLQPEIDAVCVQMEKEVNKIKRDYSSRQARKLEKLIRSFKQKEVDAKSFYGELKLLADTSNLSMDKYPNIKIYISLLDKAQDINNKRVITEFTRFISEVKNVLPYQQYSALIKNSNNFTNLEDISADLIALNKQYSITAKLKLAHFENFLSYLEFNQNINPIKLVQEEENFINELYVKLGRTKYEKEVAFLADFIPTIKQYFSADISADEYYKFEKRYELFKTVWPSYFSENIIKNLEPYKKLLTKYHQNNITRDQIFADCLITQKNTNNGVFINDINAAVKQIKTNLNNKKLKLVVTGGFHTRGLERIFEQQRISYVIITPKITQPIEQAKQIYIDNVIYYSNILKNTINLEPLTQEPLNVSFPKILNLIFLETSNNTIFEEYSKQDIKNGIKEFVKEYIIAKQSDFYGSVEILNWDIISDDVKGKAEFYVEYKDNANKGMVSNTRYRFSDGEIIPYSSIDTARTRQMLERITTNKYAQPSVELEPTNATRKKIAKYILEPLKNVAGDAVKLMPFEQLHMTIGYDSLPTQQEIDSLVERQDQSSDIFSVLEVLGEDFVNFRTSMAGTLKLMPDGVIIYEITDKDLIERMLQFRTIFKSLDTKYKTPNIVHMSIGRISDMKLLDGSEQSKQELAELLEKINETIYEINKKKALSKVKTTFTLKSGYVSSTGDKDFAFRRLLPKKESLVVLKNLVIKSKITFETVYEIVIAPIVEETIFRFIPFIVIGMIVSNPASIVPAIVTGIIGIFGFSFAHPLADKINNLVNKKVEGGEIKNSFIAELFSNRVNVRNVRDFFIPSTILTAVFITASFVFPQSIFAAIIISSISHSVYNLISAKMENKLLLTLMQNPTSQDKNLDSEIDQIIETLEDISRNKYLGYRQERNDFIEEFENIGKDKNAITQKIVELFNFVSENHKKSNSFDLVFLLEPVLNISAYLRDEQGNLLFDKVFDYILKQATDKKNNSTRYFEVLMDSAKYFYKTGQIGCVHKIFDSLYKNKGSVITMTDYKKFALPVPSPFSFGSIAEWEYEVYKIMDTDDSFAVWFIPVLEVLLSSSSGEIDEYAKAYIRALYKSGKATKPPFIRGIDEYEWTKSFYEICEGKENSTQQEQSEPLLDEENIKLFADNAEILKTNNLYLSDIISRLQFLKQDNPSNEIFNSEEYAKILEQLNAALALSKQEQIEVVTTQMNELAFLFIDNDCFRDTKVLKMLVPIMAFIESTETSQSLLSYVTRNLNVRYVGYEEMVLDIISFMYDINRQESLSLIKGLYNEFRKQDKFGANRSQWTPKSLQAAYANIPAQLKDKIKTYKDLEEFYYTIGIEFDSIQEESAIYDRRLYIPEYQLLLDRIPASVSGAKQQAIKYFRSLKKQFLSSQATDEDNNNAALYFEALEDVLENNILALSEINKANRDAIEDSFYFIEEMINSFAVLNEEAADKAKVSLERMKKDFYSHRATVSDLVSLKKWAVADMDKITELHTLINAVHQTAIGSLMSKLKFSNIGNQYVFKENDTEHLSFFDCSRTGMSKQMEDFVSSLNLVTFLKIGVRIVSKDNKIIYSKSLGAHSVDIMVDLDEGIRVTFNDSGRGDGNAMRVLLLASLFSQVGFDITNIDTKVSADTYAYGVCNFTAMYSLPKGAISNGIDYAKYFEQALNILGDVTDLDYDIEGNDVDSDKHSYYQFDIPSYSLEDFAKLKNSTNMPRGFERISTLKQEWQTRSTVLGNLKKQIDQKGVGVGLDDVYDYLSISSDKRNVWEIVSEYVKGKLTIDDNGILARNEKYDGVDRLLSAINRNVDDSLRQAQVINLLDYDNFNFETEGYIGGMVALSGLLRLDGKGWLSVKTAVDKERKRTKFAYVEFVDFDGNRTNLDYKDLIKILKEFGYAVKEQKPRSASEKKESLTVLKERILFPKDGIYTRGMSVSGQSDRYIPERITYKKANVNQNTMWVVSYTTPEDVATIMNAGAIMTTTGGMLSHANITARENHKTAILSNGQWVDGKLVVPYYSIESPIEQKGDYEIQKISEHRLVLEEGDVVLANGLNGRVLVYRDIPAISEIQKAIDNNDTDFIIRYIQNHYQDKNIRKVVEYIFLQVVTEKEKEKITQFLLAWEGPEIKEKISELVKVYTGEKIKALKIYIENEKNIKDASIRLAVIKFIEQELDALQYSLTDDEIAEEKRKLSEIVTADREAARSQIAKEVKGMVKQAKEILSKTNVSEDDKDELIKIREKAIVWKLDSISEMASLIFEIDKIISLEKGIDYETEIRDFEDIRAKDVVRYGTKTTELAKLARLFKDREISIAGIPDGIGISKDVLRIFFEHNGISQYPKQMKDFENAIKEKNRGKAIEIGKRISSFIENLDDEELEAYLGSKLDSGKKYAVRSSGVGEDGENHAFAGMAKTMLNVGRDDVYASVKEGWKSFFTTTCIEDMIKNGIVVQPALLIQEMVVDVKKAGVVFTRDNSGNLTMEGVLGLGEGLVSGRITPDHVTVRASDGRIEYRRALNNMIKIEEKEQGGTRVAKITDEERIERILDEETIKQLQETANILEEDAGYPVDIEFAIDGNGKIFVLQRRAITTLPSFEKTDFLEQKTDQKNKLMVDQAAIDNAIQALSGMTFYDELKEIMENLSNLPEDVSRKYAIVVEQIYELIKFLKKNHKKNYNIQIKVEDEYGQYYKEDTVYGKLRKFCLEQNLIKSFDSNVYLTKVLIYILVPFLKLVDIRNSDRMLFYSIIDSLFFEDNELEDRDENTVLSEMGMLMSFGRSVSPDFIQYIVDKLVNRGLVSADEEIPFAIKNELKGYDGLKEYYFAVFSKEQINENLSKSLTENAEKLRDVASVITDETAGKTFTDIASNIEEIADKINDKNIVLLEYQLDLLLKETLKLKDTDKSISSEIIKVLLSICEKTLSEVRDLNSRTFNLDQLEQVLIDEYDNPDKTNFDSLLSQLILLVQPQFNDSDISSDSFNKKVVQMLINLALHIYAPISSKQIQDENSEEYQNRKKQCLDIFRYLTLVRPQDVSIYESLFNTSNQYKYNKSKQDGVGFNLETLEIVIDAARQNRTTFSIDFLNEDFISDDAEQLADMILESIEYVNPVRIIAYAFSEETSETVKKGGRSMNRIENPKTKQLAYSIIDRLVSLANDETADINKRKRAVILLLNIVSDGVYSNVIKDVPIDFENVRMLANNFDIPIYLYMSNVGIKNINLYYEYNFTPLIKLLPQDLFERAQLSSERFGVWDDRTDNNLLLTYRKPVMTKIEGETDMNNSEVGEVLIQFELLQKILQYNTSVLSLMGKIEDSKNYDKSMAELLSELQAMIDEMKKINKEHGDAAQIALENIKESLKESSADRKKQTRRNSLLLKLSNWTVDGIKDIKEIHTLINAVHQTSIQDFKQGMKDLDAISTRVANANSANIRHSTERANSRPIQIMTASQQSTVSGYNLSNTINSNIIRFLSKLATRKLPYDKIDDFVCKDDLVVWTTRLNAHSVDIFFNFGDVDRGISIFYRERPMLGEDIGKKERIRYFKEILEYLGFHVDTDTQYSDGYESYGLKATLNKDFGLSDSTDLIDIATHVVEIFKFSTNVDYDLKNWHRTIEAQYKHVFELWLTKAKRRESWYGVNINNYGWRAYGYGPRGENLAKLPEKRELHPEGLNMMLSYLGCDLLPTDTEKSLTKMLEDPNFVNKYFNEPIERAFAEGRLILNEDGILVRNEGYDIVNSMIDEINTNFTETSQQARIVNLVNNYEFDTRILADIGSYEVVSSVMELKNGDKLFVRAIMDPNTKRTKYAIAELVTTKTRQKLTSEQLIQILGKEGYKISKQEWVDSRERQRTKNLLTRDVQTIESPKIQSTPTSDGTGVSVVGNITFEKKKVNENSILVVPYTTPDDIKDIETARGIITTGGGVLSHAAITTRELKKPSVVLSGATWADKEIETLYYLPSGEVELLDNQFQVRKVKTARKTLKEGTRVLMNGETGMVLLFDDIDVALLDELQNYINSDDAQAVIDFMKQHSTDENINRFVEYVYFQVIGNVKTTQVLDSLFSDDMPETVKNKINKLNDGYIQDKIQNISEAIENLKTVENVNIAYNILQELIKKLNFIKTIGVRQDLEDLKKQIEEMEKDIKKKLSEFMQQFINQLVDFVAMESLDTTNVQKILTMIKNVEIYKYFVSEDETSKDLLAKKDILQALISIIKKKVNAIDMTKGKVDLRDEISLFEENASDERIFGSKTSQLAKMFKLLKDREGVTVPGGIGIGVNVMPELFKTLGQEKLLAEFEKAIKNRNKERAMELAKAICEVIDSDKLKGSDKEKEIKHLLGKFIKPDGKYSVRSSGVGEDATNNAFAGMGETSLNVKYGDVYDNVRKCWKSFFAERCIDYMISSGQVVKPAVLVEEMIDSEISGVAFTRNKYGNATINVLFGQGEGLVSGMFTPDSILVDMNSGEVIEYSVANKQFKLVTDVDGGIKKVPVGSKAKTRALNSKMVKKLTENLSILENAVGYPIDVEFSIVGDEIYILQMRPITTLDTKEKSTEKVDSIDEDIASAKLQEIPFAETKHEISLEIGKPEKGQEVFVCIANPSDPQNAIPVYRKSVNRDLTEFIVDSKYADIIKTDEFRRALVYRLNMDPVVLAKLNDGLFNYKSGEIGLLPILDEETFEKVLLENTLDGEMKNIRKMLASA
ncbi:MAG: hypothetical protein IKN62_01575 [Elusimicrobia bacterium]|nr:hypothetical protein [Elusimicrobiota bacterium]